jgi:parvulin-like peptidyl-prolyl isomerase
MKKLLLSTLLSTTLALSLQANTVATVNGEQITEDDLNMILRQAPNAPQFAQLEKEMQGKVVEQAVSRKLLIQNALKEGIEKHPEFQKALEMIRKNIALEIWMKTSVDEISISEKEAKAFYQENLQTLTRPKGAHAYHILLKTEEEAKKIIAELKNSKALKADFTAAAVKHSTGPSASKGGDLGTFGEGQMVKPFSDAAFALKAGEMTMTPVKTQFGYHIIFVEEQNAGGTVPYAEVKTQMNEGAKMQKFKTMLEAKVEKLKKSAKITVN